MALPAILSAGGAALGLFNSIGTTISGARRQREANRAIRRIEENRLKYNNVYDDLRVSREGSDFQREQLAQLNANALQSAQMGGGRAIAATMPVLTQNTINQSRQIGADLDQQMNYNLRAAADYQAQIQSIYDQRQRDAILGYGQELYSSRQDVRTGIDNMAGIMMSVGSAADSGVFDNIFGSGSNKEVNNQVQPQVNNQFQPTIQGGLNYQPTGFSAWAGNNFLRRNN